MFVLKILNNTMDHMSQLNCLTHNKNTKCVNCSVRLIAFCGVLDDQSISKLDNISKDKKLSKGQHIFFQGDNVKSYFNIKQGSVKLYKLSKDGRKQIVYRRYTEFFQLQVCIVLLFICIFIMIFLCVYLFPSGMSWLNF